MHRSPVYAHAAPFVFLGLLLVACGSDGPTDTVRNTPGVRAVLGAGVTDTIDARSSQALIVEVRRPDGELARGVIVRLEAQPPADTSRRYEAAVYVCSLIAPVCGPSGFGTNPMVATDTTDSQGRVKAVVRLGRVAGRAVVRLAVPEFGFVDSAIFTVAPGAAVRVRATAADTALDVGASATLRGRVVDRYNNTRQDVPALTLGAGSVIALDAATSIVTGREVGTQWVYTRQASLVDSTSVRVTPSGRLVVWSFVARAVRLVNLNGSGGSRTTVSGVSSDQGAFPRFDPTRQRVTLYSGSSSFGGTPNNVIVIDTSGAPRRDIGPADGFSIVTAVRQLADGNVLVVGRRATDVASAGYSVWRVAADNAITLLATLPALAPSYGGADISHDGTRVAYLAAGASFTLELRVTNILTGATTVLGPNARSPRWSLQDDRVAYLVSISSYSVEGTAVVINADGTGRRGLGSAIFSPGLAWSPDGVYLVGRSSTSNYGNYALRVLGVTNGVDVLLRFRSPNGAEEDYFQPDWR